MGRMRRVTDTERRARLARRHALAPAHRVADPLAATEAMTVLHATEAATVHLAVHARVEDVTVGDVERALYLDRTLVKQLAMRRTLFVFPRDLLPAAWGSASARVAGIEKARMAKDIVKAGLADDGEAWVDRAREEVLAVLAAHPEGLSAVEVRERVPMIGVRLAVSAGAVWGAPRVLTHLGATADIVRGRSTSHWRLSRYQWELMDRWLGEVPRPTDAADGYAELVRRWLLSFGPGTEDDLVWWLGATKGAVRAALAAVEAVEVALEDGAPAYLLPEDLDEVEPTDTWAALLPVLDPTVMGWKRRDFYLGDHGPALFDRNGNAGTTAWVDGRVVGCWVQDDSGVVRVHTLEPVPRAAQRLLEAEAERLTAFLDGVVVGTVYPSAAMKAARSEGPRAT